MRSPQGGWTMSRRPPIVRQDRRLLYIFFFLFGTALWLVILVVLQWSTSGLVSYFHPLFRLLREHGLEHLRSIVDAWMLLHRFRA